MEIVEQLTNKILIKGECPRYLEQLLLGKWRLRENSAYSILSKPEAGSASKEPRSWVSGEGSKAEEIRVKSDPIYDKLDKMDKITVVWDTRCRDSDTTVSEQP